MLIVPRLSSFTRVFKVIDRLPPGRIVPLALTFPLWVPPGEQYEPPEAVQVHDKEVSESGMILVITTPTAVLGPLFVAMIVYTLVSPGDISVRLSVIDKLKETLGVKATVSVDTLFEELVSTKPAGAVILAEFTIEPVAPGETLPLII